MTVDKFDEIFKIIGNAGRFQLFIYCILSYTAVYSGMTSVASVFLLAKVDFNCHVENGTSLPKIYDDVCNLTTTDQCNEFLNVENEEVRACTDGYEFDTTSRYYDSVTTEFELVCSDSWKQTVIESTYFIGFFVGAGLGGYVSDNYGRRTTILIGGVATAIFNIAASFLSVKWYLFMIFRFFIGISSNMAYVAAYVYCMEIIGPDYRSAMGIWVQACFAIGYGLLSPISYLWPSWTSLQIVIGCVAVPQVLMVISFVGESPRYLFVRGEIDKAKSEIENIAVKNNRNPDKIALILDEASDQTSSETEIDNTDTKNYSFKDLFINGSNMRLITINCMFNWFANSIVYYGLSLNAAALPLDLYWSNAFYCFVEVPAYFLAMYLVEVPLLGRKGTLVACLLTGGIACLLQVILSELSYCESQDIQGFSDMNGLVLAGFICSMVGKSAISISFAVIYNVTAELFPTQVRSNAVGLCSMVSRLGGIAAPGILGIQELVRWLPGVLFGVLAILAGGFSWFLPETYGCPMLMSFEQANEFYDNSGKENGKKSGNLDFDNEGLEADTM